MSEPGAGVGPSRALRDALPIRHDAGGRMISPAHLAVAPSGSQRSLRAWLVGQFGDPRGVAERLAECVMAHRPSNRQRNTWTVGLLGV